MIAAVLLSALAVLALVALAAGALLFGVAVGAVRNQPPARPGAAPRAARAEFAATADEHAS